MRIWLSIAVSLLVVLAGIPSRLTAATAIAPPHDFGGAVRAVFATKCASCHGPGLAKPKARFGYVLDLPSVAGNPEMVIPGRPEESELWSLVSHGEMPPRDAPFGPLTPQEKETIRAWIAAGAPDIAATAAAPPPSIGAATAPVTAPPVASFTNPLTGKTAAVEGADPAFRWLGKFHLLLIHFPIALVIAAGIAELLAIWRQVVIPSRTVGFCLRLGAIFAAPTAALGWLFAASGAGAGEPSLALLHRWLGTAAAAWLVAAAVCDERDIRRGVRSRAVQLLILSAMLLTGLAAHFGGLLVHGADFYSP